MYRNEMQNILIIGMMCSEFGYQHSMSEEIGLIGSTQKFFVKRFKSFNTEQDAAADMFSDAIRRIS